jgi:hypothetical protein
MHIINLFVYNNVRFKKKVYGKYINSIGNKVLQIRKQWVIYQF